ncbi:MAG: hypothetical protein V3S56_10105, partial [Gemmatimonadota bacterium]
MSFRLLEFEIEGVAGANGAISPAGDTTVTYGSSLEFTASPKGEYLVRIWSVDGEQVQIGGDSLTLSDITADHLVDVSFSLLYYIISPSGDSNGSIDPDYSVTAEPGDSVGFSADIDDGYEVRVWEVDGSVEQGGGSSFTLDDIQSDHSVSFQTTQIANAIDATAGPGGSVSPTRVQIHDGGNETFTAVPDDGYEVDTWFMDDRTVQTGGATFEISPVYDPHTVHVTFKRLLAYSLGIFEFEDEQETEAGIASNNSDPDQTLVLIESTCPGSDPDNSVMTLRNRKNAEGQIVNARAKGTFGKTDADEVLISFKYLFASSTAELAIYVSDSPLLLAPDDPLRSEHYIEIARLAAPPVDRPGSKGSDRFGVFEKMAWTGDLDLSDGLYVELELIDQGDDGSVCIDSWSAQVQCYGMCLDVTGDNSVDEADFLKVLAAYGLTATGETACLEGAFSTDGYVDSYDVASWDWAMSSDQRLAGYCGLALTGEAGGASVASAAEKTDASKLLADVPSDLSDLLIAGKRGSTDAAGKLEDSLYVFDSAGESGGSFAPASNRCNISLVKGPDGQIYQLNSETGLVRLDGTDEVVVASTQIELASEPRDGKAATVYVGIQGEGSDSFGRPILDVAFDAEHVYVVPVVVSPDGGEPYTAVAKLKLSTGELVELYDDAPPANDNQRRNLREIELDSAGNLYVLNVHSLNESDILWRYGADGTVERVDLGRPGGNS